MKLWMIDKDTPSTDGGVPMNCYVERVNFPIGTDQGLKTISRVWLKTTVRASSPNTILNVYLGTQYFVNETITWRGPFPFDMSKDNKVDVLGSDAPTGRYISIRFSSNTDADWELNNFDLELISKGKW
jgi:hypothetical protein